MFLNCGQEEFEIESWHYDEFDPAMEGLMDESSKTVDMEEGEYAEDFIFARFVRWTNRVLYLCEIGDDVRVGEHYTFRETGRSR